MNDNLWIEKIKYYKEKLNNDSENPDLWIEYAKFLDEECDSPQELISAIKKIQVLLPDRDMRLQLGDANINAGNFEIGIRLIKEYLLKNKNPEGYCILADAYKTAGRKKEAIKACEDALLVNPKYEEAYYLLGELNKDISKQKAISYYKKAIEIDGNYQLAISAIGRELANDNSTIDEAIDYLQLAYNLDEDDGWTALYLANAFWKKSSIKEAEKMYLHAIKSFPEFDLAKKWFADFLESQGRIEDAKGYRKMLKNV